MAHDLSNLSPADVAVTMRSLPRRFGEALAVDGDEDAEALARVVGPPPVQPPLFCDGLLVTVNLALGQIPTTGDDVILGTPDDDVIGALAGNDVICSRGGDDRVTGGAGNDLAYGGTGDDIVDGNGGNDILMGRLGEDTLSGGAGDDTLNGGQDNDACAGNGGTDTAFDCQSTTGVP